MTLTSPSDDIADFMIFLTQLVGVDLVRERAGAPPDDIERLASLAKLPLPALYVGYLREFGAKDAVVLLADDADTSAKRLIHFYLEQARALEPEIPEHGVVIGVGGLSGQRSLIYPDAEKGGSSEPHVVTSWWGEVNQTIAQNFRTHIYRQAFITAHVKQAAKALTYKDDSNVLSEALQVAMKLDFQPYWFSDDYAACLERDDGAVLRISRSQGATIVRGNFPSDAAQDVVFGSMVKQLGMQLQS